MFIKKEDSICRLPIFDKLKNMKVKYSDSLKVGKDALIKSMDDFLTAKSLAAAAIDPHNKSRPYAHPAGFWTLEVFHNGFTLIPEANVHCAVEPYLNDNKTALHRLGTEEIYEIAGKTSWSPVTVSYTASGDDGDVGSMLVNDWEELQMAHHCTGELTYWLGPNKAERTWTLDNWIVQNFMANPAGQGKFFTVDLTFLYSQATLTRH